MIDDEIIGFLQDSVAEAYPDIDADKQVVYILRSGKVGDKKDHTSKALCTETLPAIVQVDTRQRLDRDPFVISLLGAGKSNERGGYHFNVEYLGHTYKNLTELSGKEQTFFRFEFTHTIKRN